MDTSIFETGVSQFTELEFNTDAIETSIAQFSEIELVTMIALGVAVLFAGYKIKKVAFFIVWFILGLNLTHFLLPWLNNILPDVVQDPMWQNFIPIAGGLLLALMGFSIERVCVGGIAFALTLVITQYFNSDVQMLPVGIALGVVAAVAAVMLMKPATVILTSVAGSYVITLGIITWAGLDKGAFFFPMLIGIAILGSVIQFITSKHR